MRKFTFLLLLTFGIGVMTFAQPTAPAYAQKLQSLYKGTVPLVQPADLAKWMQASTAPLILDTRSTDEYRISHLQGAEYVDYKAFDKETAKAWDHSRPIIVYCSVGYRSERIGEQLLKWGFKSVHNLYGGIFEWVNQGHPVVDGAGRPTMEVHTYNHDWGQWLLKGVKVY